MLPHAPTLLRHLHRLAAPTAPDAALLARWLDRRDQTAFAELVARHGPMVLGVCRRVLGDVQHAEDAFQATFLVLARKAADLRRPEALPGFLHSVALRLARKAQATAARRSVRTHPQAPEPTDPRPDPLDVLTGRELLALLEAEVARLPEVFRLPVLLCLLQERPVEEAARLLGWSVGSVRGRLARARARLRVRLARRGLSLSVGAVALLAPAVIPERLQAAALQNLVGEVPLAVNALAAPSGLTLTFKAICFGLLLAAVGLAVMPFGPTPQARRPVAAAAANLPAQGLDKPRLDRHGDPLPPGAVARLGTLRFRTLGEALTLAFAPDGSTIAVSSGAGLDFFETATGKRSRHIPPPRSLWAKDDRLVFSPDSKRLATRKQVVVDRRFKAVVRIWEMTGERKMRQYDAEHALWVGWSAGGEPLAVCLEADGLRLHELAAGRSRRFECPDLPRPELYEHTVFTAAPGGRALAVEDEGRQRVHVWDTVAGRPRRTFQLKGNSLWGLTFSPDGRKLVSVTNQAVQCWDVASGDVLYAVASTDNYRTALFSPDGKLLAVVDAWRTICFWDAATGKERGRMDEGDGKFVFSPDSKILAMLPRHGSAVRLWNVATGRPLTGPTGHTRRPGGTFSPDGRRVVTASMDGTVHVWDAATGEPLCQVRRGGSGRNSVFSADGRRLFSAWTDDEIWVCDARTGERQHVLKLDDPDRPDSRQSALSLHLSADGKTLVAFSSYYAKKDGGSRYQETLITGWDTSTHKQLFRRRHPDAGPGSAVSADARVLAVAHPGKEGRGKGVGMGPLRLEDLATGEPLLTFPALEGQTWPVRFSPDRRLLAASNFHSKLGKDGRRTPERTLRLWEVLTAAEVLSLPLGDQSRVAFSADGRLLAMYAPGKAILLWDLARGRELRRLTGFDAEVTALAFAPDGRRLLSGLGDSTLLIWDVGPRDTAATQLGPEGVAKAWADLAAADAPRAFRARGALVSSPAAAVALLKERLRPTKPAEAKQLRRLLADLGSERFAVRDKAQAALEGLGDLAEGALRRALTGEATLEVRRRVEALLARLRRPVSEPEALRCVRAVAVLEDVATPAARELLAGLAGGAPDARLTREASAALERVQRRHPGSR